MILTETGIVLSRRKESETNAVIHCLNQEGRIIPIRVHGIFATKKRDVITTEPGSLIEFTFYQSESERINSQKEAVVKERFDFVKESYEGLTVLAYILELTEAMALGEPMPELYTLVSLGIDRLNTILKQDSGILKINDNILLFIVFYKVRILKITGLLEESEIIHNLEKKSDILNFKDQFRNQSEFLRELASVFKFDLFAEYYKKLKLSKESLKELNLDCDRTLSEYITKEPKSAGEIVRLIEHGYEL
jgi:hypothetical protein